MKNIMCIDFGDLLQHAENEYEDLFWNGAHEILVKADMYEGMICEDHWYPENYGVEPRACEIVKSFMQKHNLKEMYITPKNCDVY